MPPVPEVVLITFNPLFAPPYSMFIEPQRTATRKGWIEVICGSMFSGKTEELIRRLKRARIAHQQVEIFKPAIDVRYDLHDLVSHDNSRIRSTPVESSGSIGLMVSDVDVVGIDEAQFFDDGLPDVAEQLALKGTRVIIAGLDMDFRGLPFGPIPALLSRAEYITKLHAICMQCGDIAGYSYRKTGEGGRILLGEKDLYEPRCRDCFYKQGGHTA
jgi:thymidine kinase